MTSGQARLPRHSKQGDRRVNRIIVPEEIMVESSVTRVSRLVICMMHDGGIGGEDKCSRDRRSLSSREDKPKLRSLWPSK